MRIKRLLALLLTVCTLCGTLAPAATAAESKAKAAPFTDIYDADTAEAAELLRLLGIVNGTGGTSFSPEGTLTRAEFCKMAVELMGNGDKVAAQMNRTIFKDVPSTHWARGYINVATQGGASGSGEDAATIPGIIRGDATGNFHPDTPITYAEAVTILMRILGYSDSTVGFGAQWYDGYLNTAKAAGLTDGLDLAPTATLTRGQSARLMDNLLHTEKRGEKDDYMISVLKCKYTEEVLVFDTNATAPDGTTGSIKVEDKTYKTDRTPFPEDLIGTRAKLLLDEDDKVLAVEPSTQGTNKVVGMLTYAYTYVKAADGAEIKVKPETPVWKDGEKKTYKDLWQSLSAGTQGLFHYTAAGELDYIFLRTSSKLADQTQVATSSAAIGSSYKVYKNGVPAASKDIRQYDVMTYDNVNNTVYVSDLRLTGVYQNAYPGPDTPVTVTMLGCEFAVLDSAFADLAKFKIGDQVTLLFSYDGKVAGAVDPKTAKSTTVGVVEKIDSSTGAATVNPINESLKDNTGKTAVLTGETSYKGNSADAMVGQLVTVSASQKERITLSKLTGSGAKASLKMADGTMGDVSLAENVIFYERVGNSAPKAIDRDQITVFTVPASKITYVHTNYAGDADIVVLDDVTGDVYEYGFLKYNASEVIKTEVLDDPTKPNGPTHIEETKTDPDTLTVKNTAAPNGGTGYASTYRPRNDAPGGIVASLGLSASGKAHKLEAYVLLTKAEDVDSAAFNMEDETVTVDGEVFPVSKYVECYNKQTKTWFASTDEENNFDALNAARAFAQTLTVYYDKSPENGGKIRLVVVE